MSVIAPLLERLQALKGLLAAPDAAEGASAALALACRELEAELGALTSHIELACSQLRDRSCSPDAEPGLCTLRSYAHAFRILHERTYLDAARELLAAGQAEAGLDLLAALLCSLPDSAPAHEILDSLAGAAPETARRAHSLSNACRLERLEVFGQRRMDYPFCIATDAANDALYVSDHRTAVIHRFDLASHQHSMLRGPWQGLMGLCLGPEGLLWACDYAGRALYGVDGQGQVQRRIGLDELLGGQEPFRRPEYLCASGGIMYLQTCTPERTGARLWSFDPADPTASLRRYAELPLSSPAGVHAAGGKIFAAGSLPATIAVLDAASGDVAALLRPPCREIYQIAGADDGLYVTHTEGGMLKLGPEGRLLYAVSFARVLGEPCQAQGLALDMAGGVRTLYLADGVGRCIRSFAV